LLGLGQLASGLVCLGLQIALGGIGHFLAPLLSAAFSSVQCTAMLSPN
jgi:hypothetical protein